MPDAMGNLNLRTYRESQIGPSKYTGYCYTTFNLHHLSTKYNSKSMSMSNYNYIGPINYTTLNTLPINFEQQLMPKVTADQNL